MTFFRFCPLVVSSMLVHLGCGAKAPPLAPFVDEPAAVTDLSARRLGPDIYLEFTIPARNSNGREPADISEIRIYGFTGEPVDERGFVLNDEEFFSSATLVEALDIRPPPVRIDEDEQKETEGRKSGFTESLSSVLVASDSGFGQGELASVVTTLNEEAFTVNLVNVSHSLPKTSEDDVMVEPFDFAEPPEIQVSMNRPVNRYFATVGLSAKGRVGPLSKKLSVPLYDIPLPPSKPALHYTENEVSLSWLSPIGAPSRVQELPEILLEDMENSSVVQPSQLRLSSAPIFEQLVPYRYNVYEFRLGEQRKGAPHPLNSDPLTVPSYVDTRVNFGTQRCYAVLTVATYGDVVLESDTSESTCIDLVDTFPPAAPEGLGAVGSEGGISLIWNANTEEDLDGYLVLRGTLTNEALVPLMSEPISETTYRDADVKHGQRYVYAVVAVDTTLPPNLSAESNRVTETAR